MTAGQPIQPSAGGLASNKLDPTATIGQAFSVYTKNAPTLLPIAFGLFAIQAVLALVLPQSRLGVLILGLVSLVLTYLFQGIIVEVARDVEDGRLDSSFGQLVAAVRPAILPLFLVSIVTGLAVLLGLFLFIVPGFIAMTWFALVAPVVVLERPGVFDALGRSRQLVKGSGWQVFALILFTIVLANVASRIGVTGSGGAVLVSWVISSLIAPLTALVIAVAYLRLRDVHGEPPLNTGVATPQGPRPI